MAINWSNPSTHGSPTYDAWGSPTNLYASDDSDATATEGDIQDLGGFSWFTAPLSGGEFYKLDTVNARLEAQAIGLGSAVAVGVKLSWDGGTSWTSQYVLTWANVDGEQTKEYSAAVISIARKSWGRYWTWSELSSIRARLTFTRKTGANIVHADNFQVGIEYHAVHHLGGPGHYTSDTRIILAN